MVAKPLQACVAFLMASIALAGCMDDEMPGGSSPLAAESVRPAYERGQVAGDVVELDLWATETGCEYSPHEGKTLSCMAFADSPDGPFTVPGPEIRVTQGDTVRVTLHSPNAFVFHTIHWHGISVPWEMDGVPYMTQALGDLGTPDTYVYEFEAFEPGTYWYHCHVEAPSHIDVGLFGAFIVEPADPSDDPAFDREYTLLLHEADSSGLEVFSYGDGSPPSPDDIPQNPVDAAIWGAQHARYFAEFAGFFAAEGPVPTGVYAQSEGPRDYYPKASIRYRPMYDTFMINGKSFPETEPLFMESGETVRIRLINAGQNPHTMHLHGHHFLVTHRDGYPLPAPFWADSLLIGSGGRYDIYVYGDNPGVWDFHDHGGGSWTGGYASNDFAFPGGMATALVYEDFAGADLPRPTAGSRVSDYLVFAPSYRGR